MRGKVLILMGSESDRKIMSDAETVLKEAGYEFSTHVSSAHRAPDETQELVSRAADQGFRVIIAGAGLAAALPGFCASFTRLPVIGVPLAAGTLAGIDALLSISQMPPGVPVATVGINNSKNAAHLALRILELAGA